MTGQRRAATRMRAATADDVDAVTALEQRTFGADAWSRASMAEELTRPLRRSLVAVDETGAVCGYVVLLTPGRRGDVADLQRIVVAVAHRRQGIASALLAACDLSRHERIMLEVRADNAAALGFYERHGFSEISRRRGYYADGTDAVVMQCVATRPQRTARAAPRRSRS